MWHDYGSRLDDSPRSTGLVFIRTKVFSMIEKSVGFTLLEMMVSLSIIGIMVAVSVPNVIAWRDNAQVNAAAREIKSSIDSMRMAALKSNLPADVNFNASNSFDTQTQEIQSGVVTPLAVITHQMPAGVTISKKTFSSMGVTGLLRFTNRGLVIPAGRVEVSHANGLCLAIFVSTVGSSRIDQCP